jgi:glyoxylase-like metal-dependent hydrolase (beta-lactamase superfamily II)
MKGKDVIRVVPGMAMEYTMNTTKYKIIKLTDHFYQLGIPAFPVYLSIGDDAMLIEGGTGAIVPILIPQIKDVGIDPDHIKYITLTHSHLDHLGAIPHLKKQWPHLKVVATPAADKILRRERAFDELLSMDRSIVEIMLANGGVDEAPPSLDDYTFEVDMFVNEGDEIDLGAGVVWTVHEVPGHSPCEAAYFEDKERTLVIGDATGFHVPELDAFWPNYFQSLELYCDSIRKLAKIPANRGVLSHNGVIEGQYLDEYFHKVMASIESYHRDMLESISNGENPDKITQEQARWVKSLQDIVPMAAIQGLTKILLRRSQSIGENADLFGLY